MKVVKYLLLAAGLAVTAAPQSQATDYYTPRQYYSSWHYYTPQKYYYRTYYYKPNPTSYYHHHYVTYHHNHSSYGNNYYYYNPYKKQYWGRCPTSYYGSNYNAEQVYSLLPEGERKESLSQIPPKAFPTPGPMPTIPEAAPGDNTRVELPPDDLPADVPSTTSVPKAAG